MYNNVSNNVTERHHYQEETSTTRIIFKYVVSDRDKQKAYGLMRRFMDWEPTNIVRNYTSDVKHFIWKAYVEPRIQQNLSVCAIDADTDEMIGMVVNFITKRGEEQIKAPFHPVYAPHQRFLSVLNGNVFQDLNCKNYFTMSFGYVRKEYTCLGVLGKLSNMSEMLANSLMCDAIVTSTTSEFAYRAAKKRGCQPIREITYTDYVDPLNGEKVFAKVQRPHWKARMMYKRIPKVKSLL